MGIASTNANTANVERRKVYSNVELTYRLVFVALIWGEIAGYTVERGSIN